MFAQWNSFILCAENMVNSFPWQITWWSDNMCKTCSSPDHFACAVTATHHHCLRTLLPFLLAFFPDDCCSLITFFLLHCNSCSIITIVFQCSLHWVCIAITSSILFLWLSDQSHSSSSVIIIQIIILVILHIIYALVTSSSCDSCGSSSFSINL